MSSVGIINLFLAILVVFEYRGFRKNFIHFSANTFPISTVVISLGNYIGNLIYSKKMPNLNDRVEYDDIVKRVT